MDKKNGHYKDLEIFLTVLLLLELGFFILYLVVAGSGVIAIKVICAIIIFLVSAFSLWILYKNNELLRQRSLWLTCGFCGFVICTLVSLLAGFPAP